MMGSNIIIKHNCEVNTREKWIVQIISRFIHATQLIVLPRKSTNIKVVMQP